MDTLSAIDLHGYFSRIGYVGTHEPSLATLDALIARHTASIPFENLDVLLGRPIRLDAVALQRKLIHDRRGGYCFEQNGLLLHVLVALGYRVTPLSARVRWQQPREVVPPRTHLFLRVEIDGVAWLVDVGVGGLSPTRALRLVESDVQETSHDRRRLAREHGRWFHQVSFGEDWLDVCEFTLEEMPSIDQELANWFTGTHPCSHFKNRLIVARTGVDGSRFNLLNDELTVRFKDGRSEVRRLSLPERLEVLEQTFGLHFPPGTRFELCAPPVT